MDRTIAYLASKVFTMRGVNYSPGDTVDVSELPNHKITQFLNQRYIRPAPTEPAGEPVATTAADDDPVIT